MFELHKRRSKPLEMRKSRIIPILGTITLILVQLFYLANFRSTNLADFLPDVVDLHPKLHVVEEDVVVGHLKYDILKEKDQISHQGSRKTVLVTGAAGFIGWHVARYCAQELDMKVVAVDDHTSSDSFLSNEAQLDNIAFVQGDINNAVFLETLFARFSFDYVYHLAPPTRLGNDPFLRSGSLNVLNAAVKSQHKVDCFVFASSNAVYGEGQEQVEDTVPQPDNDFGISTYTTELNLRAAYKTWGLDSVILRLGNVYGPNQNLNDETNGNAIGTFVNQLLSGDDITIFGSGGEQTHQFTFIHDVAPIIAKAPLIRDARNQVINVGSDQSYTLNEVALHVSRVMGRGKKVKVKQTERKRQEAAPAANVQKFQRLFRPPPAISLRDGLKAMSQWLDTASLIPNSSDMDVPVNETLLAGSGTKCHPPTIAILISGQLNRFVYKEDTGPLVPWTSNDSAKKSSSSWWGCGKPIVDVYIVLQTGPVYKPWQGTTSTPPYINDNITATEIQDYFQQKRGANKVVVEFVDQQQIEAIDSDLWSHVTNRNLPDRASIIVDFVQKEFSRFFHPYSRMFYLRHRSYALAVQQPQNYSAFVCQRDDNFFYEPLNFTSMGFDYIVADALNGEQTDLREAKAYVFVDKWCPYGFYSDKIQIGNSFAISTLYGKTWPDFLQLMMRWIEYGYLREKTVDLIRLRQPALKSEAYIGDLLKSAIVEEVDLKRIDVRYVDGTRCVSPLYFKCQDKERKIKFVTELGLTQCNASEAKPAKNATVSEAPPTKNATKQSARKGPKGAKIVFTKSSRNIQRVDSKKFRAANSGSEIIES